MSGFRKAFKLVRRAPREKQIKLDPTHILETLPIAVVVVDEQDVISDVNYAAEEFFGASKNILQQSNLGELLPVDHPVFLMMERAALRADICWPSALAADSSWKVSIT